MGASSARRVELKLKHINFSGVGAGHRRPPLQGQKTVEVCRYFVDLLTVPGDLVLDMCCGTGSMGLPLHRRPPPKTQCPQGQPEQA